jgi:outer membrane protein TolC
MKRILASLILIAVLPAGFTQTNPPAAREMSLTDCFAEALAHNLDLQIKRYSPQISLYDLRSAYGGYDPVFSLSGIRSHNHSGAVDYPDSISKNDSFRSGLSGYTPWGMSYDLSGSVIETRSFNSLSGDADGSGGQVGVNVTQPLLRNFWVDNTRLSISVAKNRLKFSEQSLRLLIINTVTEVENAYYELISARENLHVQQQGLELAQTQLDQDKKRVELGSLAPLDVKQDETQVAQSRASLISAQFTLAVAQNTLKNLLTDSYLKWHDVDIAPTTPLKTSQEFVDVQTSWSTGMAQRPDLMEAKLDLEQQGFELKYLRNQVFPQLDLVGSYGVNGTGREFSDAFGQYRAGNRPFYSYGAQLSIPLSNARARNSLKIGKANEQQILLSLKKLEQNVMVQIDNAVKEVQSAWEAAEANRQARTYAEAALDAEQKKYAVGKSTTFTVLQLQNSLTKARSNEIFSLANYNKSLSNLAAAEASTLERNKLDLQVK